MSTSPISGQAAPARGEAKPIAGFFIVSLLLVVALAPLLFATPWFDALDAALTRTGIVPATDYVTAWRLISQAPESLPAVVVSILQPFAPDIAAFIIMLSVFGTTGVVALLRKYRFWAPQVGWRRGTTTWAACVAVMIAISLATAGLNHLLLPAGAGLAWAPGNAAGGGLFVAVLIAMFLDGGAVAEETGWRGFVLPLLQGRYSPLIATLVLSGLWTLWHMPVKFDIILEEGVWHFLLYFLLFGFRMMLVSIIITFFFNRLGGSTLVAIAIHGLHNDSLKLMGTIQNEVPYFMQVEAAMIVPLLVVALTLIVATRGRLGFTASLRSELTYPPEPTHLGSIR